MPAPTMPMCRPTGCCSPPTSPASCRPSRCMRASGRQPARCWCSSTLRRSSMRSQQAKAQLKQTALNLQAMRPTTGGCCATAQRRRPAWRLIRPTFERSPSWSEPARRCGPPMTRPVSGSQQAQRQLESLRAQARVQLAKLGGDTSTSGRAAPGISGGRGQGRRGAAATRPHHHARALRRRRDPGLRLQPGQYLAAATPAFALVSIGHPWVDAPPKETDLTYVKPGDLPP